MNWINLIIGVLLIILGIFLIKYYRIIKRENQTGTLSFKLQTAGIELLIREFKI
jgi:hypothetical protein